MKEQFTAAKLEISLFLIVFFADIKSTLLAIAFLIAIDTIVGIWASCKEHGLNHITSRRAGRIITKLILYPVAIIVAKVAEQYLAPDVPIIKVVMGILAAVEVKSIFENISVILGFDLWNRVKNTLWKQRENK